MERDGWKMTPCFRSRALRTLGTLPEEKGEVRILEEAQLWEIAVLDTVRQEEMKTTCQR